MKKILEGEMPEDFWNYLVNPITGYYIEKTDKKNFLTFKKYAITPQPLKQ